MKKIIPILLVFLLFTSCSIHKQIRKEITRDTKSHDPEINPASFGMVIKPIVADLKVEATKQSVTYIADLKLPLYELKNNAIELFLTTHKCDYVVDPIFSRVTTVENSRLSDIKITITGFPATYSKIYQVDSLPKSVVQYSSISLPVKRVDYTNNNTNSINIEKTKCKHFGMEVFTKGSSLIGAQVDYAKNVNGLHYYLSIENYGNPNSVSFDYNDIIKKSGTITYPYQVNLSIGIFKEKIFSNKFKIRGFGGLNYSSLKFIPPIEFSSPFNRIAFTGFNSFGVRIGAALDYSLFNGISIIGRLHANVNMLNSISQNQKNTERVKIENIQFSEKRLLNPCIGIRLNF
jgi:hypothetical protein